MKECKRKGLDVRCEENEEEAGCSKDVKKRQVSKSTFYNWQRKYEKEHQSRPGFVANWTNVQSWWYICIAMYVACMKSVFNQ